MKKIYIESLGCSKNLVDAEIMNGVLKAQGYQFTQDLEKAHVALINTCGFIESAKSESIERILHAARYKQSALKKLLVTGCLAERYAVELKNEMPEIDGMVGTGRIDEIVKVLEGVCEDRREVRTGQIPSVYREHGKRERLFPSHVADLKIADGCDNCCTYCVIPRLRGSFRSRHPDAVVEEASQLAAEGVKELNLVAQDTTQYGKDLSEGVRLPELLRRLDTIEKIHWIRLMYCYPEQITPELLDTIRYSARICAYLDLPIQHSEDEILQRMNRRTTRKQLLQMIEMIREKIPGVVLRTTVMVGFPGETEKDFQGLLSFIETAKFEKLGAFKYSQEEDTPAFTFPDQISEEIKEARYEQLMQLQQKISNQYQRQHVGQRFMVMIDEMLEENPENGLKHYAARTQGNAPEIDGLVYVQSSKYFLPGELTETFITDAMEYDLLGVTENEVKPSE